MASRVRKWSRYGTAAVAASVVLGVVVSHQFPALTNGRRSSVEVLEEIFQAPLRTVQDPARYFAATAKKKAAELFVASCDLPPETEANLLAKLKSDEFDELTVPFLYYLVELYGAPARADPGLLAELAYGEPLPEPVEDPALSDLVRRSPVLRKHIATVLRLYDALYLRPEAEGKQEVGRILRQTLDEMQAAAGPADKEQNEYAKALEDIIRDDRRLAEFSGFFRDFVRVLTASWLESFVERQDRIERRVKWVQAALNEDRYHEVADYARARAGRKLVLHIVVDGLQGKLLEGLVRLSEGRPEDPAARYVQDLVRQHREEIMQPTRHASRMPPPLGDFIQGLSDEPPAAPGHEQYLENFKKYFYDQQAPSVTVNVASVETPSISVRNLPILFSGHGVAGTYGTGIPNFSYLDRPSQRGWYFYGSDSMYLRAIFANREEQIPHGISRAGQQGARTLFERLWRQNTASAMAAFDTGALEKLSAEVGMAVSEMKRNFSEKAILLRMGGRAVMERELNEHRRWLIEHRSLTDTFLGSLIWDAADLAAFREHALFLAEHEDEGLPDYLLWYNPWPDHYAHSKGPFSDPILGPAGEYDRLDYYLGKMLGLYEGVPTLDGQATYADRMLVGLTSDHGLIYTPKLVSNDQLLLDVLEREQGLSYHKLTADEGGLPILHERATLAAELDYDAVIGSTAGGSYILDLFNGRDPRTGERTWANHPDYHDLKQQALLSGKSIDFMAALLERLGDEMDLALVREHGPAADQLGWPAGVESVVRIVSKRGDARIYRLRDPAAEKEPRYRYEVLGEQDPLDLAGSVQEYLLPPGGPSLAEAQAFFQTAVAEQQALPDAEWQRWLSYTTRLDVIHQFSHIYDTDRAGTINVFPVRHVGMNSAVPGRHAGEMFEEKNGVQLYRATGLAHGTIQTARNGCLPVTLFHWLAGERAYSTPAPGETVSPSEQFAFPSLLNTPEFKGIRLSERSLP